MGSREKLMVQIACKDSVQSPTDILGKLEDIKTLLYNNNIDLLAISETWLNEKIETSYVAIDGYTFLRRDRGSRGGGVGLYISNSLKFKKITSSGEIEQLWDVDKKIEYLSNAILSVLDVHAPYKLVRFTKKPMHLRDAAKAKFNQTKSVESWEKYKKAKNFATQAVRNEKKAFFNHLFYPKVLRGKCFSVFAPAFQLRWFEGWDRRRPLSLVELLNEIETTEDIQDIPDNIVIFPPNNANDPVANEDSGEEENVVIDNLPGSQLPAECEFSYYDRQWDSDDEKRLSNFAKQKPKKTKKFSFSKRDLQSNLQTWIPVQTVKNQQSPTSVFTSVFDDEIIDMIDSYNLYAQQTWKDTFH
nr:unnamed protein product [Callosobruchus chinensis]